MYLSQRGPGLAGLVLVLMAFAPLFLVSQFPTLEHYVSAQTCAKYVMPGILIVGVVLYFGYLALQEWYENGLWKAVRFSITTIALLVGLLFWWKFLGVPKGIYGYRFARDSFLVVVSGTWILINLILVFLFPDQFDNSEIRFPPGDDES